MSLRQRFLLDQMFDRLVAAALREDGYEVDSVSELGMAKADDEEIMTWAICHHHIVITLGEHC